MPERASRGGSAMVSILVGRRFMTEPVHNGKCIGWR
jgi:hypothetical protein